MVPSLRTRAALGAVLVAALAGPGVRPGVGPAAAQSAAASPEARAAQFVFVIDDSRSMQWTDPNRLAVFAVQSLLGMLDDRDEVSVVRLNGPLEGAPPPPIAPLRENRARMERLLDLGGAVASYNGRHGTTCNSALQAARGLLEEAYRPEAAQVVFFLTDGECTGEAFGPNEARAFLDGLTSHASGQLQFYLLRFRGQDYTRELAWLAEETDGAAFEVAANDPTAVLHPFARALSRSQGYDAYLLSPADSRLPAHRGAERVRLLAVAPDQGGSLDLGVRDSRGHSPAAPGSTRSGVHQYRGGQAFRYAALDFRPDEAPVTVSVGGAGSSWKVVAVPEYRLTLGLRIHAGPCSAPGEVVEFGVDTGTTVCAVAALRNAQGEVVGGAMGGDLVARIHVRRPEEPGAEAVELVANPLGDEARFGVQRSNLAQGQYEFEPEVTLRLSSGETVSLRGRPVAVEVSSIEIAPEPAAFDLGTLAPGDVELRSLRFGGSFPPEPGRIDLTDRREIPSCVTVGLSGVAEGTTQPIRVGHGYELAVRVAPYCGPESFEREYRTVLRLSFDQAPDARRIPAVELPFSFRLRSELEPPPPLVLELEGGEAEELAVPIAGNFTRDLELAVLVAGPEEAESWPEDRDHLALHVASAGLLGGEGGVERRVTVAPGGASAGGGLLLRARAHRCCAGGTYRTYLGLTPTDRAAYAPGLPMPDPVILPVEARVASAGFWACWGPVVLWTLAGLLLLLLLLYLANMVRNSRFLDPRQVADRLRPLVWTAFGGTEERRGTADDVRRMVRRGMPWTGRLQAWLKANPLRFGLPGGRYEETLELALQPHPDPSASQVRLVPERQAVEGIRQSPSDYWGRLFASARAGVTFVGVPDVTGRISQLAGDAFAAGGESFPGGGDPPPAQAVTLRRAELRRPLDVRETPEEGAAAGWRVG